MSGKGTDGERYARWVESRPHFGMRICIYPTHEQAHVQAAFATSPSSCSSRAAPRTVPHARHPEQGTLKPSEWHGMRGVTSSTRSRRRETSSSTCATGTILGVVEDLGAERRVQESFPRDGGENVEEMFGPWRAWISPGPS